ncbi:MAG TPA: UdgX family uracil-DNA binding protein [Caulobacteraceae bacterium]|jgi:DNA polymerase
MKRLAPGLVRLTNELNGCRRCDLWRAATQAVPGEGAPRASMMLVGEQPGDQEDLAGEPFVGPAGRVLDDALALAGIPRSAVFVTNAVKHFKHEMRGKRRLHKRPDAGEIEACRFWLESEIDLVAPKVIVALGATAAGAVLGRPVPVMASRGRVLKRGDAKVAVTIHPSYVLRQREPQFRAEWSGRLSEDLRKASRLAEPC